MLIRFTRLAAGNGWTAERGDVLDLPEAEARRLIARNHAEEVPAPPVAETVAVPTPPTATEARTDPPTAATVAAPERAVQPRARGRF